MRQGFSSGLACLSRLMSNMLGKYIYVAGHARIYLDLQSAQYIGPYTAYTLYLGMLGHSFGQALFGGFQESGAF